MAQPLFDQHPLEEYFRNTGEVAEPMPGGSPDFVLEQDDSVGQDHSSAPKDMRLPSFVVKAIQLANELLQTSSCTSHENSFAERFKYDVISSSLLSSSLSAPSSAMRRSFHLELPGKLDDGGSDDMDMLKSDHQTSMSSPFSLGKPLPIVLLSFAVVVFSTGYIFFAMIPLVAAIYVRYAIHAEFDKNTSTTLTLEALNELVSAGNVWDSAINEAIMLIESEERSIFYGPTSPRAPSSALRIALQSSLHTTQTQCDNVRQLLSALTNPTTLSQLAEMYAPSSPMRSALSLDDGPRSPLSSPRRPFSDPTATWRHRMTFLPNGTADKRATWNGSYAALAVAGSPTTQLLGRKRQNRRSDVMSLFQPTPVGLGLISSMSAPVSPQPPSMAPNGVLEDVLEEDNCVDEELESKSYFGAAALDLQRKRKSAGLDAFIPPPVYSPPRSPVRSSGNTQPPSMHQPSSSRLTAIHTTRHPLSLSGLHLALQGAIAAKRYSCSHLLALRFSEDEDDSYWENVRSVTALLTSSLSDASTRLIEALDEDEKRRKRDEHPTPPRGNTPTPHDRAAGREKSMSPLRNETSGLERYSFAPMPSNMARLAGHIDAITTAMKDAREHMGECIAALRQPTSHPTLLDGLPSVQDHPAFQAYDRLRKELGFALRECERGRERLLEIISPRPFPDAMDDDDADLYTPGLKHDSGSESSEKGPVSPNVQLGEPGSGLGLTLSFEREDNDNQLDDATAHLLLTASSQHLPPPGVEQVFEGESGNGASFVRERSKLSREERIKMMKARRVSGMPLASLDVDGEKTERQGRERWGPGGEVVQELKDVIWKVGEQRRKMSLQLPPRLEQVACEQEVKKMVDLVPSLSAPTVPQITERETCKADVGIPVLGVDAAASVSSSSPLPSPPSSPPLTSSSRLPPPPLDHALRIALPFVAVGGVSAS